MRAIIFANGILNYSTDIHGIIQEDDYIIAADGGWYHCEAFGLSPHLIIGDLDSISAQALEILHANNIKIIQHPQQKDETDLELAFQAALEHGVEEILVFAALGGRWDMTAANLLLPGSSWMGDVPVRLIDGYQEIMLIKGGKQLQLYGKKGDMLSLIPLGQDAVGITLEGMEYPLEEEILKFGSTRGISNVLTKNTGSIFLKQGFLLCVHIHGGEKNAIL